MPMFTKTSQVGLINNALDQDPGTELARTKDTRKTDDIALDFRKTMDHTKDTTSTAGSNTELSVNVGNVSRTLDTSVLGHKDADHPFREGPIYGTHFERTPDTTLALGTLPGDSGPSAGAGFSAGKSISLTHTLETDTLGAGPGSFPNPGGQNTPTDPIITVAAGNQKLVVSITTPSAHADRYVVEAAQVANASLTPTAGNGSLSVLAPRGATKVELTDVVAGTFWKVRARAFNDDTSSHWTSWSSAVVPRNDDETQADGLADRNKVNPIYRPDGSIVDGTGLGKDGLPNTADDAHSDVQHSDGGNTGSTTGNTVTITPSV